MILASNWAKKKFIAKLEGIKCCWNSTNSRIICNLILWRRAGALQTAVGTVRTSALCDVADSLTAITAELLGQTIPPLTRRTFHCGLKCSAIATSMC